MSIERNFDIPFVASLALREKQIQQNYRPIIAVHKWFARRPGTLFRGLLLSEFGDKPLRSTMYAAHDLKGLAVADPFMGGGTPLIEANRLGCDVTGFDINPMSWWIVNREIEHLDLDAYGNAAKRLTTVLEQEIGDLYRTRCLICGSSDAQVKYFLWVKQHSCHTCGKNFDLFPGYLVAEDRRHPTNVLVCHACGDLNEVTDRKHPGPCTSCKSSLHQGGPAKRNRCVCPHCQALNSYAVAANNAPAHRMFAIEYYCHQCKSRHAGRFFKRPDLADLAAYQRAEGCFAASDVHFVPDETILPGDESDRLLRWGYRHYREMFNARQLLGLELSCRIIAAQTDLRVKNALITNLSDLLRYQNMVCRYDTMALKSLDIFSVHGFPVGLVQCESNLLGIAKDSGGSVGSGGWSNIIDKYLKAKNYCEHPFETRHEGQRKVRVPIVGEWIGDASWDGRTKRRVELACRSATDVELPSASLDAVLTDPPYFGNVQYAELMDFCYVWLRRLAGTDLPEFRTPTTRNYDELTDNATMERGLAHFTTGLSAVFHKMALALKPGRPLAFTYHHNRLEAYLPVAVALLDAGLTCSAALPCPAEMGASIHISGTGSSIVDTVFVCRSTGTVSRRSLARTEEDLARLIDDDLKHLKMGGVKPTRGDTRCITFGHLIRLVVWNGRKEWDREATIAHKLHRVRALLAMLPSVAAIEARIGKVFDSPVYDIVSEAIEEYGDEVTF